MSSGVGQAKLNSNWWFGAQVSPKNAAALFEIIVGELEKIFAGELERGDIEAAQQYALGRFQRGAQTVSGTANGYSGRYFFDEIIDDYYQVPKRIKAVTKESIIEVARELFKEQLWGFGSLGNCGEEYASTLQEHIEGLWSYR
jgi:predicted Zn-dependent peptidase